MKQVSLSIIMGIVGLSSLALIAYAKHNQAAPAPNAAPLSDASMFSSAASSFSTTVRGGGTAITSGMPDSMFIFGSDHNGF